jgi:hypothetical protein
MHWCIVSTNREHNSLTSSGVSASDHQPKTCRCVYFGCVRGCLGINSSKGSSLIILWFPFFRSHYDGRSTNLMVSLDSTVCLLFYSCFESFFGETQSLFVGIIFQNPWNKCEDLCQIRATPLSRPNRRHAKVTGVGSAPTIIEETVCSRSREKARFSIRLDPSHMEVKMYANVTFKGQKRKNRNKIRQCQKYSKTPKY